MTSMTPGDPVNCCIVGGHRPPLQLDRTSRSNHMASYKRISFWEILPLVILCGFALAFLLEATKLQQTAALFPRLVAEASLFVFVIALAFRLLKSSETTAVQQAASISAKKPPNATSFGAALTLQAAYVAAVFLLGFPIATLLYLVRSPRLLASHRRGLLLPHV